MQNRRLFSQLLRSYNQPADRPHETLIRSRYGMFKPPIGHGLMCSQETKSIAMLYDTRVYVRYIGPDQNCEKIGQHWIARCGLDF